MTRQEMTAVEVARLQELDMRIAVLVAQSEALYAVWGSDAAFYVLRAAAAVADTPAQGAAVRQVAVRRRDEHLHAGVGVTAANSGAVTLDRPLSEALRQRGYRDSYAALVDDIDRFIGQVA